MALLATLCLGATGCNDGPGEKAAGEQRIQQAVTDIKTQIEALPTVVKVTPQYHRADNLVDTNNFSIYIDVEAGAPFEPVLDGAERIVWLSHLYPLSSVDLGVWDSADRTRLQPRTVLMTPDQLPSLTAKYGPRPSP